MIFFRVTIRMMNMLWKSVLVLFVFSMLCSFGSFQSQQGQRMQQQEQNQRMQQQGLGLGLGLGLELGLGMGG
ncbi:uncharacterized protein LOC123319970 isoform X2 [Coccinella septempunctata]|uniref:uncharacterized protein LOC123319970 isoform X2 n=1 Tax=Coccinella septempunctata TaxID=41139 RepID=UPI001D07626E|nr:uncharacterized protein LOC123319970 isoform X2 [Coccinella septempunctata]